MGKYQLFTTLLGLILLVYLSGVEGQIMQYPRVSGVNTTPSPTSFDYPTINQTSQAPQTTNVSPYSQYYTMGTAPNAHVTAPQQLSIEGNTPSTVYLNDQRKPMAYSQYQSSPTYRINSLWIKGSDSWTRYAAVPQGAIVPLLAISSNGGTGHIKEMHANGQMKNYDYFFYPYSQLTFYADTPGRNRLSFSLAGQPSNHVVIEVNGTNKSPSNYGPPSYNNGYYLYDYGFYPFCGFYPYCGYYPYWDWGGWWGDNWSFLEGEMHKHHGGHGWGGHGGKGHHGR
jgi:hypothetical protein